MVKTNDAAELNRKVSDAKNVIKAFEKTGKRYLIECIRGGFIGKEVYDKDGVKYIQASRGKPYGYMVAIADDNKVYVGYSLIHGDDEFIHPVIGKAIALKKATENLSDGIDVDTLLDKQYSTTTSRNSFISGNEKAQLTHFKNRAYRFFWPKIYAAKGTDPIYNNGFSKIKAIQLALKCIAASSNTDFGLYISEFKKMCKNINKNLK
jgi:hypothetical protein